LRRLIALLLAVLVGPAGRSVPVEDDSEDFDPCTPQAPNRVQNRALVRALQVDDHEDSVGI